MKKTLEIQFNGTWYFITGDDMTLRCDEKTLITIIERLLPVHEFVEVENESN